MSAHLTLVYGPPDCCKSTVATALQGHLNHFQPAGGLVSVVDPYLPSGVPNQPQECLVNAAIFAELMAGSSQVIVVAPDRCKPFGVTPGTYIRISSQQSVQK